MSDLYTEIVNTTHALIVVLDADGRVVMFNPACERVSGYRFEEVKGRHWSGLPMLPPHDIDGIMTAGEDLAQGRFPNQYENEWITKSGAHRFIEWSNSAVTDESGRVTHVIGTGIDVTEKRAAQNALRETVQRQHVLLNNIPDAAWLMDSDGRYIAVNRTYAKRWGLDRSNMIGKTVFDVFPAALAAERMVENRELMRTGEPLHVEKHRVIDAKGCWLDVTKIPIADDNGKVIGIACVSRDISEHKLAAAQRMVHEAGLRATLLRELHHRIKNSMQGAVALLQQLATGTPESTALIDAVSARLNAIANVHGIYGAVGEHDLHLQQILLTLVSSLKTLHPDLPVHLSLLSSAENILVAQREIVPFALIVNELIMNAVKHSRGTINNVTVEIAFSSTSDCARIVVSNPVGRLPEHFDFSTAAALGTGLRLVKAMLPPAGAQLRFENATGAAGVRVELNLGPPVIVGA